MTSLTIRERRALREAVLAEIESTEELLASLTSSFDDIVGAAELVNTDDEHDPEGTTIAFERSQVKALLTQAEHDRAALRDTLERIGEPGFGTCEHCQRFIGVERLLALPTATRCVHCAR